VPLLTDNDVLLLMRRKLYTSCVHSCVLHGSKTALQTFAGQVILRNFHVHNVSEGPAHMGWLGVVMASGDMSPRVAPF